MKTYDVFGLGSAVMDILVMVEETELLRFQLKKGIMRMVDEEELKKILEKIAHLQPLLRPGGSVANTCAGVARLGGKSWFCGLVGSDEHGLLYEEGMQKDGVEVRITKEKDKGRTAVAVSFVTPDTERTFATHLGISLKATKDLIVEQDIANAKIAHFEGYMLEGESNREASLHSMDLAKKHDTLVSLDVSDAGLIRRILPDLKKIIEEKVDILFLNEDEAKALTGKPNQESLDDLAHMTEVVILKIGKEGSFIRKGDEQVNVAGIRVDAVDTTGAGDLYAAGFLYGYANGYPLERCGALATMAGAKAVEQIGARLDYDLTDEVKAILGSED